MLHKRLRCEMQIAKNATLFEPKKKLVAIDGY
jgi:hypothetical protein